MAQARHSTRAGTTTAMFALAWLSAVSGVVVGVVFMVHTSEPGCTGWVGCGTNHPDIGVGVVCILAGLLLAAVFAALALIARAVGETQAALLTSRDRSDLLPL